MTATITDWRRVAQTVLAEMVLSGKEFTAHDLTDEVENRGAEVDNQMGNFLNSWRGKGLIYPVRTIPNSRRNRRSEFIRVWKGVYVSDVTRYQVMPPLSPDEYQELYDSIKSEGVHDPIHIDEDGVIIDGHHRSKIARELGIPCPVIAHDSLDEQGKRSLAFTLNLKRRHLSREQRRALGLESLRLDPIASNREHSKRTGLSDKTIQSIREDQGIPEPREIIAETAEANPEKSNRELARELGVSDHTVASVRGAQNSETPNFAQEEKPTATTIPQDELDELNALPTEQPTMEPQEENGKITFTRRGTKAQKNQLRAADRLASQIEAITLALDHEFPLRTFDKTFTQEKSAELAKALRKAKTKLGIHINRLEEFSEGA